MPKLPSIIFIFTIACFLLLFGFSVFDPGTGDYSVKSAYGSYPEYSDVYFQPRSSDVPIRENSVPILINSGDLPFYVIVSLMITAFTAPIILLLKSGYAAKFPFIYGYSTLNKKNILKSSTRREILDLIRENPGISIAELQGFTGFSYKNLKYHLDILESFEKIVMEQSGSFRYFLNSGDYSYLERKIIIHLRNINDKKIIQAVVSYPGISRKGIIRSMEISGPSISWHINKMVEDGIIVKKKEKNIVRHYLSDDYSRISDGLIRRKFIAI